MGLYSSGDANMDCNNDLGEGYASWFHHLLNAEMTVLILEGSLED